jgi:hypothetical protein
MMAALAIPPPSHMVCSPYRPPALLQRVDERGHDARTAGTQRMSDRDRAAVDVRRGQIGPGVFGPGQYRLGGAWIRRLKCRNPGVRSQCSLAQYFCDKQDCRRASEGVAHDLEA